MNAISSFQHIVVATDLSDSGNAAWDAAMKLAALAPGCKVTAVYAVEPIIAAGTPELAVFDTSLPARIERAEEAILQTRNASPGRSSSHVRVEAGFAGEIVHTAAEELKAGMIVVASHGRRGLQRFLLGSTAERIVHSAPCAVLVLKPDQTTGEWDQGLRFSRILAAYDASSGALLALQTAVELAAQAGGRVLLTEAVEELPARYPHQPPPELLTESERVQHAVTDLKETIKRQTHPELIDLEVSAGKPWQFICDAAAQRGATLIVLGPHGHRRFGDILLGSTAERVVRHAPCPVLITSPMPIHPAPAQH